MIASAKAICPNPFSNYHQTSRTQNPADQEEAGQQEKGSEKSPEEVDARWREMYRLGLTAVRKKDYRNAARAFDTILQNEPGFVECRDSLHALRIQMVSSAESGVRHSLRVLGSLPCLIRAVLHLHSHPIRSIAAAEQALDRDPYSAEAHKTLARAALHAGWPRTALISLRYILQHEAVGSALTVAVAVALNAIGETSRAVAVCGRLLKTDPENRPVNHCLQQLLIAGRLKPKRTPGSLREAAENISCSSPSGESARTSTMDSETEIRRWESFLKHGPRNHQILKKLGALYLRKMDWDRALEYYWRALQVARGRDSESERAIKEIGELKRHTGENSVLKTAK